MLALTAHVEIPKVPGYVTTGEELVANEITEIPMLIDPIFPKVGVVAVAGSSDTGKSSLLRQMAMEIVLKRERFLAFQIKSKHNSIIYVSTEDDYLAISCLIKKQNTGRNESREFAGLRFIFETDELLAKIEGELKRQPADAVIIDAFADLFPGNMNQVNEVRNYLQGYSSLAQKYGCLFVFLHHTSKRTDNEPPSKHNMIGSQGFEGKMRTVVELRRDFQNPSSSKRHFCVVKGNYVGDEDKNKSYVLRFTSNLVFESTGERVPFENLAPANGRQVNIEARDRARELREEGLTIDEIFETMREEGFTSARSTIGTYIRDNV